jgi:hypothetical protein
VLRRAFPAELVPMIEAHMADHVQAAPNSLVFTSREALPLRHTKFRPHWADACNEAKITGFHFHDLRGSGATWAATAGATVRELVSRLGHATPAGGAALSARHLGTRSSHCRPPRRSTATRLRRHTSFGRWVQIVGFPASVSFAFSLASAPPAPLAGRTIPRRARPERRDCIQPRQALVTSPGAGLRNPYYRLR